MTSSAHVDMQAAARVFFSQPTFAVAGASSNPAKFGYKIFQWYVDSGFTAVPLNPSSSTITVENVEYQTKPSVSQLEDPSRTALSVITPPPVTAKLLEEAKKVGIQAVWLQPGTFTDKELNYALKEFPGAAIGGFADGTRGGEGWCVLVDGDAAYRGAQKEGKL